MRNLFIFGDHNFNIAKTTEFSSWKQCKSRNSLSHWLEFFLMQHCLLDGIMWKIVSNKWSIAYFSQPAPHLLNLMKISSSPFRSPKPKFSSYKNENIKSVRNKIGRRLLFYMKCSMFQSIKCQNKVLYQTKKCTWNLRWYHIALLPNALCWMSHS